MQPMVLQFRYLEMVQPNSSNTTTSSGNSSHSSSSPANSNLSNNYKVVTVKKTFSPDMVIGEIVSLLTKEFKISLQQTNNNNSNSNSNSDEYGLLYYMDAKTNFWLEETEKLATYDLYQKEVREIGSIYSNYMAK